MLKNQKSIDKGIAGATITFEKGDIMDSCPKLTNIIGIVNASALEVIINDSLILKNSGIFENIFLKNPWEYKIPRVAKNERWKLIS